MSRSRSRSRPGSRSDLDGTPVAPMPCRLAEHQNSTLGGHTKNSSSWLVDDEADVSGVLTDPEGIVLEAELKGEPFAVVVAVAVAMGVTKTSRLPGSRSAKTARVRV